MSFPLKRIVSSSLATVSVCLAAGMNLAAQSQPQFVQVGTLPEPTSTERAEVFDPATGTLYSFIYYTRIGAGGDSTHVYSVRVADGLFNWRSATPSPSKNYWGRGCASGGYLYFNGTIESAFSRRAPINADGSLGAWVSMSALPAPNGVRSLHQTFVHNQRLYIMGGWYRDNQPSYADVWQAPVQAGGDLGAFTSANSLPRGVSAHSSALSTSGTVYVCAGTNIYAGQIQPDGALGPWMVQPPVVGLDHVNRGNTAAAVIGDLLVIVDSTNTFACRTDTGGRLQGTVARISNPEAFTERSVYVYNGTPYVTSTSGKIYRIDNLPVGSLPSITIQPVNRQVAFEGQVTLSTSATGTPPLNYQWFLGSTPIQGATSSSYTVTSAQPRDAGAYTVVVSNTLGSVTSSPANLQVAIPFTYQMEQGTCSITGYTGTGGAVRIPSSIDGMRVSKISDRAFASKAAITRLDVPGTLESIGTEAFIACNGLTNAVFENGITSIGQLAFSGTYLSTVAIPQSVTNIGPGAFTWNPPLQGIEVDPSNRFYRSINGVLFDSQAQLLVQFPASRAGTYTIPSTVSRIGGWAFNGCWHMTQILLPERLESIGPAAFSNCTGLRRMIMPATVVRLDEFAFGQCANLGDVLFLGNAPSFGTEPFYLDAKAVAVFRPDSTGWATTFGGISTRKGQLPSITRQPVGSKVDFTAAVSLSTTATGTEPLTYQWFLGSNPIPDATSASYTINSAQPRDIGLYTVVVSNVFGTVTSSPANLQVSMPFMYQLDQGGWTIVGYIGNGGVVRIPSSIDGIRVFKIADRAFAQIQTITSVDIPSTVNSLGNEAFIGCYGLTNAVLAPGLSSIGQLAFSACNLKTVQIPGSATNIGPGAFTWNVPLNSIQVDSENPGYRSIDGVLFNRSATLLVQFPASRSGPYTAPNTVRRIGGWAFNGCTLLTDVILPEGLESTGESSFGSCVGLRQIELPKSVNRLGDYTFGACAQLVEVFFRGSAPSYGAEPFYKASNAVAVFHQGTDGWGRSYAGIPTRMVPLPPSTATATLRVVSGFVVGVDLTDFGGGYTNTPRVRIFGGGGSGAAAVAAITNGSVASIRVVNAGSGYTNQPVVVIDPPFVPTPTVSVQALLFGPNAAPVIQLDCNWLAPYDPYQIEFIPELGADWTKLGEPFMPTARTNTQYANGLTPSGFYRVRRVE